MKKLLLIPLGLVGLITMAVSGSPTTSPAPVAPSAAVQVVEKNDIPPTAPSTGQQMVPKPDDIVAVPAKVKPTPVATEPSLSNDNHYTNSAGNEVHSPAYSDSVPAGASAQCRDGSYSFSQSRRGTCSGHGGVAKWLTI